MDPICSNAEKQTDFTRLFKTRVQRFQNILHTSTIFSLYLRRIQAIESDIYVLSGFIISL